VDPFRESAIDDLEAAFQTHSVAVVQTELVQAVGGVRAVPERILRYLQAKKRQEGYLLFVDEVQTGMYRTGPFIRSQEVGVEPDLLTIGKGTSDMMFPFAVTLYSEQVRQRLSTLSGKKGDCPLEEGGQSPFFPDALRSDLPEVVRQRFDYEFGYKTLLNVLDRAEEAHLSDQVRETGALFAQLLDERLSSCKVVHDIRVFGLLIAIELDTRGWPQAWLGKQAGSLYIMSLLRHEPFPVFLSYCQYEPHVLKFTPPLSITRDEVHRICDTLAAVLSRPAYQLLPPLFGVLAKAFVKDRWETYRYGRTKHECVER
jgi:4-aminobutyrate aminotransferase-like enzyme